MVEREKTNKILGGEKKKKNENKNISNGGNSNRAVLAVLSGYYPNDCR